MSSNGGALALLKLPRHLSLSLDGSRMKTLRDPQDVLVIRDIPPGFHLLAVRHANVDRNVVCTPRANSNTRESSVIESTEKEQGESVSSSMMTLGLALFFPTYSSSLLSSSDMMTNSLFLVREYDANTEGWSNHEIDDLTKQNLFKAIESVTRPREQSNTQEDFLPEHRPEQILIDANKIIQYDNFISQEESTIHGQGSSTLRSSSIWSTYLTNHVSMEVLHRHSLTGKGDVIIPSSYTGSSPWNDDHLVSALPSSSADLQDGNVLKYVPIPMPPLSKTKKQEGQSEAAPFHRHEGTKRYLATLSPEERTAFFLDVRQRQRQHQPSHLHSHGMDSVADRLLLSILKDSYSSKWEHFVGEFQLSFVLFLCCSCLSSLEHWRDVICMLSHVSSDLLDGGCGTRKDDGCPMIDMVQMFHALLFTIYHELDQFDCAIFDDEDYSHGNDVVPAIKGIVEMCICAYSRATTQHDGKWIQLHQISTSVMALLHLKNLDRDGLMQDKDEDYNVVYHNTNDTFQPDGIPMPESSSFDQDDDDEYGPVVVAIEEIQEAMERNASKDSKYTRQDDEYMKLKDQYPFLFAAISENEDVLMACARILDERNDATLVREAASYLEQVEAHQM